MATNFSTPTRYNPQKVNLSKQVIQFGIVPKDTPGSESIFSATFNFDIAFLIEDLAKIEIINNNGNIIEVFTVDENLTNSEKSDRFFNFVRTSNVLVNDYFFNLFADQVQIFSKEANPSFNLTFKTYDVDGTQLTNFISVLNSVAPREDFNSSDYKALLRLYKYDNFSYLNLLNEFIINSLLDQENLTLISDLQQGFSKEDLYRFNVSDVVDAYTPYCSPYNVLSQKITFNTKPTAFFGILGQTDDTFGRNDYPYLEENNTPIFVFKGFFDQEKLDIDYWKFLFWTDTGNSNSRVYPLNFYQLSLLNHRNSSFLFSDTLNSYSVGQRLNKDDIVGEILSFYIGSDSGIIKKDRNLNTLGDYKDPDLFDYDRDNVVEQTDLNSANRYVALKAEFKFFNSNANFEKIYNQHLRIIDSEEMMNNTFLNILHFPIFYNIFASDVVQAESNNNTKLDHVKFKLVHGDWDGSEPTSEFELTSSSSRPRFEFFDRNCSEPFNQFNFVFINQYSGFEVLKVNRLKTNETEVEYETFKNVNPDFNPTLAFDRDEFYDVDKKSVISQEEEFTTYSEVYNYHDVEKIKAMLKSEKVWLYSSNLYPVTITTTDIDYEYSEDNEIEIKFKLNY
jgi:hypothetical protein